MKFFSRDSLVEEISGIKKSEMGWATAKQEIHEFDKIIRELSNYNDTQKISEETKDSFVKLMKAIYNSHELRTIIKKLGRKEHLSEKETLLLYDTMTECTYDKELKEYCKNNRDELKGDEFIDKYNEICDEIKAFLRYTNNLPYKDRLEVIDVFKEDMQERMKYFIAFIEVKKELLSHTPEDIEKLIKETTDNHKKINNYHTKNKKH